MNRLRCLLPCVMGPLLLAAGCSSESYQGPPLVPVDGIITLDHQALPGAVLTFVPTGDTLGQGAVARSDSLGRFRLATPGGNGGAAAGTYRVMICKFVMPDGSELPEQCETSPMDCEARQVLPDRYCSFQRSELSAIVAPDTPLEFHLNSKPDRHPPRSPR